MTEPLFLFLAHGIATSPSNYRAGARHAIMIYSTGTTITEARSAAIATAEGAFWTNVEIKREKEIESNATIISDDILRAAAETALAKGSAIIVYKDEIPLDS